MNTVIVKTGSGLGVGDFKSGDTVVYVPKHKQANMTHDDCEPGKVTSVNDTYVHVLFDGKTGSQACYPTDLWHRK